MNWNIFLSFWTEKRQFWMDVNVCFLRITGYMKRLTWGWVIMVISSPCTSTNTSPAFKPALCAGVSIPRTFSTWIISLSFSFKKYKTEMWSLQYLHNCGNICAPHNPEAPWFVPLTLDLKIHHLITSMLESTENKELFFLYLKHSFLTGSPNNMLFRRKRRRKK